MFRTLTFAALSLIVSADQLYSREQKSSRDKSDTKKPKVCERACETPYVQDPATCKCNGDLTVDPVCNTDFTADTTLCQCTSATDATLNYAFACKYGFALNTTTC